MRTPRQHELLSAAVAIVAEEGFSKLTIRRLAEAVGVTEPAVYRHFSSKKNLLEAILEELQLAVAPHFQRLSHPEESAETLMNRFVRGLFTELHAKPAFAPLVFSEEAFHADPELKPMILDMMSGNLSALSSSFASLQQRGLLRQDVSAHDMAMITMGSIRLTVTRFILSGKPGLLTDQAEALSSLLVRLLS
ncbi:MAG: TetR/AcrR family transcriptional regulator [Spirochaetales bacterium]|nr:TetR/AcrR family transcriptional regulator [Spirochaetales bacterium]